VPLWMGTAAAIAAAAAAQVHSRCPAVVERRRAALGPAAAELAADLLLRPHLVRQRCQLASPAAGRARVGGGEVALREGWGVGVQSAFEQRVGGDV
jgi:hypothetical protein